MNEPDQRPEWLPHKFKTAADLVKSYHHLERTLHQKSTGDSMPLSEPVINEETSTKPEQSEEVQPDKEGLIPEVELEAESPPPLIDPDKERNEVSEAARQAMNGQIDDQTLQKLERAGISRDVIETLQARAVRGQEAINQLMLAEATKPIGGIEKWEAVKVWAGDNLSHATAEAYNRVIETGDKEAVQAVVKTLANEYRIAQGPQLISGGPSTDSPRGYESRTQQLAEMNDPRYKTDPAFRSRVETKSIHSSFK